MIQIDDDGSGSLLGGNFIGTLRVETLEYRYGIVPVEFYSPDNFKTKRYLDAVVEIVAHSLSTLNADKNERIYVCRGYMFDRLKEWLEGNFHNWESTVINDPLQTIVETTFEEYAISLGLPRHYISYTKYPFHFHRLLKWVYADYQNRKGLCKQGWNSWQKYGNLDRKIYLERAVDSNYCCLICGKKIHKGSPARVVQYITTTLNRAYTHIEC